MENIKTVQQRVKDKRDAYSAADSVYYNALQQYSLSQQGIATGFGTASTVDQLMAMQGNRAKALADLNTEISTLANGGSPRDWVAQLTADLPFLLLPVRLEARYVTIRHIVRNLDNTDAIDVSSMTPIISTHYSTIGFEKDEESVMTYRVTSLHLGGPLTNPLLQSIMSGRLKPPSGRLIKRKNDSKEIRIRIYPDEIFLEGLERNLQPGEWEAGVQFWQKVCAGNDPQEQWLQLSIATAATRAAWIVHVTAPTNFKNGQPLPQAPVFAAAKPLKDGPFTTPLKTHLLPERFVVRLYKGDVFKDFTGNPIPEPVLLGLDPTSDPFNKTPADSGFTDNGTSMRTPGYINWIHNFEAAESAGMAIRIDLSQNPEYSTGVDKIIVLGTKVSVNETDGTTLLGRQLEDHLYRENGLSVIPQGTPTNNYGSPKTTFTQREEDALSYFASQWKPAAVAPLATDESKVMTSLGLGNLLRLPNGGLMDVSEASLVNELLWPATLGYYLLQFFTPDLDEPTRELARQFFIQHVSGRGTIPVLRFNRQPYGIIPVSSFANWQYQPTGISKEESFLSQLWSLYLSKLDAQWKTLSAAVKNVTSVSSQGLDDNFFKMIGVTASSGKLKKQWVAGTQLLDLFTAAGPGAGAAPVFNDPAFKPDTAESDLLKLGINPALFRQLTAAYNSQQQDVRRIFMDGRPLSEDQPLELITGKSWNFPQWLAQSKVLDIWSNDFSKAPAGDGSALSSATLSAFAILLRQAVLRTYLETGIHAIEPNNGLWLLKVKDFPAQNLLHTTININPASLSATDKLQQSYKPVIDLFKITVPFSLEPDRRVYFANKFAATGQQTLADWIETKKVDPAFQPLNKMISGLRYISNAPTASLNRLYTEHMDLCSHRLDAWMIGMVNQRLVKQRKAKPTGIYLGAFGYLLSLQPNAAGAVIFKEEAPEYLPFLPANVNSAAIPITNKDAAKQNGLVLSGNGWLNAFFYIGENAAAGARLNTISGNIEPDESINLSATDGFIHAPSTAHAVAASILRTGYLNHQADNQTALLALQLNSPRTRQALQLLEGIQQGTSLNELLGYYFERKLKENNLSANLYNLRLAFPVQRTQTPGKNISYLTTIDGMALLTRRRGNPTAWLTTVAGINPTDFAAISKVADIIEDYLDGLGDLLLAESVYQSVKGNTVRAAAALKIMNGGGQVVMPEFAKTPGKGTSITHRAGVVCQPGANANGKAWTKNGTPRSLLMPDLNAWLSLQLPKPTTISIQIILSGEKKQLSLADIGIEPIDLLYVFPESFSQPALTALGLHAQMAGRQKFALDIPADATAFAIDFKDRSLLTTGQLTIFEVSSLVLNLRKLINQSRPITANDFLLPENGAAGPDSINTSRLKSAINNQLTGNGNAAQLIQTLRSQAAAVNESIAQNQPDATLQTLIKPIFSNLLMAWQLGIDSSAAQGVFYYGKDAAAGLAGKAIDTALQLENRTAKAVVLMGAIPADVAGMTLFDKLKEVADMLYGNSIPVFPDVLLTNGKDVAACYAGRQLIDNATPDITDEWMRDASLVRKHLKVYRNCSLLTGILSGTDTAALTVLQFPFFPGIRQPWIGNQIPEEIPTDQRGSLSLVMDIPDSFQPQNNLTGFIIDAWPEWIPSKMVDTAVAFQYNQPNTEPPQSMLMVVSPVEGGNWNWDYLIGAVNDAFDLAKKRLVTPADVSASNSGLRQALPAILMPVMAASQQTPVVDPL